MLIKTIEKRNVEDFDKAVNEFNNKTDIYVRYTQTHITNITVDNGNFGTDVLYTAVIFYEVPK
jgi:hypothetical protein